MKLTRSFTLPEEDPVVPEHLAERITDWFPYTTKVDVKRKQRNGWKVLTTIQLEGGEEPSDVYTMVKAYADYDCDKRGEPGKYRALVWRLMPGDIWERRRVTFSVHPQDDDDDDDDELGIDAAAERALQRRAWMEIFGAQQEFIGSMAEFSHRATDRLLEQSQQASERITPLSDVIHELVAPYRDGLRMKADAVREVGELRLQQQLAEARANDSGKFWEMFGPAIQVAAAQAQKKFLGGGRKPRALPAAKAEPVVKRKVFRTAVARSEESSPVPVGTRSRGAGAKSPVQVGSMPRGAGATSSVQVDSMPRGAGVASPRASLAPVGAEVSERASDSDATAADTTVATAKTSVMTTAEAGVTAGAEVVAPAPCASDAVEPEACEVVMPASLHELVSALFNGLGADTLVRITRLLDAEQSAHLEAAVTAADDDSAARAVLALTHALMANPQSLVEMQRVLQPDEIAAIQQVTVLASRHLEEQEERANDAANTSLAGTPGNET